MSVSEQFGTHFAARALFCLVALGGVGIAQSAQVAAFPASDRQVPLDASRGPLLSSRRAADGSFERAINGRIVAPVPIGARKSADAGTSTTINASIRVQDIPRVEAFALPTSLLDGVYYNFFAVEVAFGEEFSGFVMGLAENCSVTQCDSGVGVSLPPEQGLYCIVSDGQGSSDACQFSINAARDTYQLSYSGSLMPPVGVAPEIFTIYTSGPAGYVDEQGTVCLPGRYDLATVGSDPAGDLVNGDCGTGGPYASPELDASVDLLATEVSVNVEQPTSEAGVTLRVSAEGPGPYGFGDGVSYALDVINASGAALSGLTVTAAIPSQLSVGAVHCDAGIEDGTLTWPIGALAAGASAKCGFDAQVVALPDCRRNCQIVVNATATYAGGRTTTNAAVGTLVPPQPESMTVTGAATTADSEQPTLSADGSLVIFQSLEKDLVGSGNTNSLGADIYLRDRRGSGHTVLISRDSAGAQITGNLHDAHVSLNGRAAAFVRDPGGTSATGKAAGMSQLCSSNPLASQTFAMHCDTTGMGGVPLDGDVESPSLSADGTLLAFCSSATNWVASDTNNTRDVFLKDQTSGEVRRISVTADGTQGDGDSCAPMISGNGRYVAFTTTAENLGGSNAAQVVRKDLSTGEIRPITRSSAGDAGDADAGAPSISSDGQRIAFASRASNLVAGVSNERRNVFIYDGRPRAGAQTAPKHLRKGGLDNQLGVMLGRGGQQPDQDMDDPKLACGGGALGVTSAADNLTGGDGNGVKDYFVYGLDGGSIVRPAPRATGEEPNGPSQDAALDCEALNGAYDSQATGDGNPNPNADIIGQADPLRGDTDAITLDTSYSGAWFDPGQSGHGFLLQALPIEHVFYATWYVFQNGQPLFLQGVGTSVGNGLTMDLYSTTSNGFPVGPGGPVNTLWGSITFTFTSSSDGMASWQPVAPGFTAGSMNLRRLSIPALIENNRAGANDACLGGNWFDPANSGYGFILEMDDEDNGQRILQAFWYTYQPDGAPLWLTGIGLASGGPIEMDLVQLAGSGANFPPAFVADAVHATPWGHATFRFTDSNHLKVDYASSVPGYGSGTLGNLQRLTALLGRTCSH